MPVSFLSFVCLSLGVFLCRNKGRFHKSDIAITYTLLIGSIYLESIAILMLILSDWTLVSLLKGSTTDLHRKRSSIASMLCQFLSFKNSKNHNFFPPLFSSQILFRRWPESVLGYNLIDYCIKEGLRIQTRDKRKEEKKLLYFVCLCWSSVVKKLISVLRLQGFVDGWNLTICSLSTEHSAWNIIFEELKTKSNWLEDLETGKNDIRAGKGDWVLNEYHGSQYRKLEPFVVEFPFDQSILLWHIATELLFTVVEVPKDEKTKKYRDCSKLISDYMSYLIVMQPQLISSVAGIAKLSFQDTCAEAIRCFSSWRFDNKEEKGSKSKIEKKEACKKILEVDTLISVEPARNFNIKPINVKAGESKSVLFDACMLANELKCLTDGDWWEIMCRVWVEMLSYAAYSLQSNSTFPTTK
ncbi:Protein of unknown function (DUF594) [Quillaja saponaria]|uniref:DUF4220 domain-containing protein n=1 Tax=Quillaja saponaria TaxID=32244 RepID=A0AAD7KVQ3_QUISA|nr:Protein of unknown function (DUF594) [Quillaja saponaria]